MKSCTQRKLCTKFNGSLLFGGQLSSGWNCGLLGFSCFSHLNENWIGKYVEQKVEEKGECPEKTR